MKLRTNGKSIRLRLRRSEIQLFGDAGLCSAKLVFPAGGYLEYSLEAGDVEHLTASFDGHRVRVMVPGPLARQWAAGDEVGIYGEHGGLEIMVERDFRRTSMPSPDDADRYPNPHAACAKAGAASRIVEFGGPTIRT